MLSGSFTRFKQIKLLLTVLSLIKNIAGIVKFFGQHDNELHGDSTLAETNSKYYVVAGEYQDVYRIAKGGEYTETGTDRRVYTTFKYVTAEGKTHKGYIDPDYKIPIF